MATSERNDAVAVLRTLRANGHVAYFAGGCVRDLLLGLSPKDYDVATDATPDRVRRLFPDTQAVGAAFGVILVRQRRSVIEVATFRADGRYTDGRRPDEVRFSTPDADAARRDFTINGLFLDPAGDGGEDRVIDFVGGRADLDAKVIRAIGNPAERFAEDHLRILRAVRFAARLGFDLDPTTREQIVAHAGHLPRISPERIAEELRKILVGPPAAMGWELLRELGLVPVIFRFLPQTSPSPGTPAEGEGVLGVEHVPPNRNHPNTLPECRESEPEFVTRSLVAASIPPASFGHGLTLASLDFLWHRSGRPADIVPWLTKAMTGKIVRGLRQGLKISNDESAEVEGILAGIGTVLAEPRPGVAKLKRFLATPTSAAARAVLEAMTKCDLRRTRIESMLPQLSELDKTEVAPPPLINGDDLTAVGAEPGPRFKVALDAAYDAQLEGRATDRSTAMAIAWAIVAGNSDS
jgi:poly(A) polymerase